MTFMTHEEAILRATEIASRVLAPAAGSNDKAGRFSTEAVRSLGESGLLGLMLPADLGGSGLGRPLPRQTPRLRWSTLCTSWVLRRFCRHGQARLKRSHPYSRRSPRATIYRRSPSAKLAHAAISGLPCRGRVGTAAACASVPRNPG